MIDEKGMTKVVPFFVCPIYTLVYARGRGGVWKTFYKKIWKFKILLLSLTFQNSTYGKKY